MPDGPFPTRIGLPTTWPPFARGSICATVPASVSATQTNPPPTVIADGPPGVGIVCCTVFVAGSIRDTTPRSDIATQIDPAPAAIASGEADSGIAAKMCPVDAETAPTAFPPSLPSSCVACDPLLENANSGTATAAAITPASAATRTVRRFRGRSLAATAAQRRRRRQLGLRRPARLGLRVRRRLDDRRRSNGRLRCLQECTVDRVCLRRRIRPKLLGKQQPAPFVHLERLGPVARGRVRLHQPSIPGLAKRLESDRLLGPLRRLRRVAETQACLGEHVQRTALDVGELAPLRLHPRAVLPRQERLARQ